MSKLFGKILSKKAKAIIISCCAGLAVAAGAVTTAVVVTNNNRVIPNSGIGDSVSDSTELIESVVISSSDSNTVKSTKWNSAVLSSQTYNIPVTVTLDGNWTAYDNAKGTYKIFGDQSMRAFDSRGALKVLTGATINFDLGGYTLDRGLVDEKVDTNNKAVIAGSVIFNEGTLNIYNGTIQHGYSSTNGGGIYSTGDLTLGENLTIRANYADLNGGGVYCEKSLTINGPVTMTGNYANKMNNSFTGNGGAIYVKENTVTIDKLTATNNQATKGGAIAITGNGASFTITNSTFTKNTAYADDQNFDPNGGAIYVSIAENRVAEVKNTIYNCTIGASGAGNTAYKIGGGLQYVCNNDLDIIATNFYNNTANAQQYGKSGTGGGLSFYGAGTLNVDGGSDVNKAYYFAGNSALYGAGICVNGGSARGTVNIKGNYIFEENKFGKEFKSTASGDVSTAWGGHVTLTNNCGPVNVGTPIARGETHPANDPQPIFRKNLFNSNANYISYGGAFHVGNKNTLNLYGGTIDQCKAVYGGAISGSSDSTTNMYDFHISRCAWVTHNDDGNACFTGENNGGSAIWKGNWNIYGGSITSCGGAGVTGITNARAGNNQYNVYGFGYRAVIANESNSTFNIFKCDISNNSDVSVISLSNGRIYVGVKNDAASTVTFTNNRSACQMFNATGSTSLNLDNCRLEGNTATAIARCLGNDNVKFCPTTDLGGNYFDAIGGGRFDDIDFEDWLSSEPNLRQRDDMIVDHYFDSFLNLVNCKFEGFTTGYFWYNNYGCQNIYFMNTSVSNNTFEDTMLHLYNPTANSYDNGVIYLRGNVKITNNTIGNSYSGLGHGGSGDGWSLSVGGSNNVIKNNKKANGTAADLTLGSKSYWANWYVNVGREGSYPLGESNEIWFSDNISSASRAGWQTNYVRYATVNGKYIAPDEIFHFHNTSYRAYVDAEGRLAFGTTVPGTIPVPVALGDRGANFSYDDKNSRWIMKGSDLFTFNPDQVRIKSFTYKSIDIDHYYTNSGEPWGYNNTAGETYTYEYTGDIKDFFEVIRSNSFGSATVYGYNVGLYTVTFEPINSSDTFNNGAKTLTLESYNGRQRAFNWDWLADYSASLWGSSQTNYVPGRKLGEVATTLVNSRTGGTTTYTFGYTNRERKVQYFTDSARTNEVSADTIAEAGTYYLQISSNLTSWTVYCNYKGQGYQELPGSFCYYWYPGPGSSRHPAKPQVTINKIDFSTCEFVAPENTIISGSAKATPSDKFEVYEKSGSYVKKLVLGTDYSISFTNNTATTLNNGMATAIIHPLNQSYKGDLSVQFKVSVSAKPTISGEPEVSSVVKAYDGSNKFTGTIEKGGLKLINSATGNPYEEEDLAITSISARYSRSQVGTCQLIVSLTLSGVFQSQYNSAEIEYSTIGGQNVQIMGKDISSIALPTQTYRDGLEHKYKPTISYSNGTRNVILVEGTDFDFKYYRGGTVTTDFKSYGTITYEAVGKGNYTGTARGTYYIGNAVVHNPEIAVGSSTSGLEWRKGSTYQLIDYYTALTNTSFIRIYFRSVINGWDTTEYGAVPAITTYFSTTNYGTNASNWQTNGKTHLEFTEFKSTTVYYYVTASNGKGGTIYKTGSVTVSFANANADAPVTNSLHSFGYSGSNYTFITSFNTAQMTAKVTYTDIYGTKTEYNGVGYTGAQGAMAYANAGKYVYTFTANDGYQFNLATATSNNKVYTVTYEITPQTLSAISFTGDDSYTYNGSAQGVALPASLNKSTNSIIVSGQTLYLGWLYTGADRAGNAYSSTTKPTDAGDYTLTLTGIYSNAALTQKALNYKLATAQVMSSDFEITPATVTVNNPAITNTGNIYIGWTLSDLTLDDSVKVTFATDKNVAGHWEWVEPDTRLMLPDGTSLDSNHSFTKAYAAKFVVDDDVKHNFVIGDNVNKTVTLTVTSLYVHVIEHLADQYGNLISGDEGVHEFDIFVDYDSTFDVNTYLADSGRSAQHGMVAALFDSANGAITSIENITVNKEGADAVHVRFTKATDTIYYQIHFREHQDLTFATLDQVVSALATNNYVLNSYPAAGKTAVTADNVATVNELLASTSLDVYIEVMTGTTGADVTCLAVADTEYSAGYDLGDSTTAKINGEGTTVVTKQYTLKTYTLSFDANGGSIPAGVPQQSVKRNAHITSAIFPENNGYQPTRSGYRLAGWSMDRTATEPMDVSAFVMPAENTILYAVWEANTYTVIFNYTDYTKVGEDKLTAIADNYFQDLGEEERSKYILQPYGTESVAPVIKSFSLANKPKYVGLAFKNWVYETTDGTFATVNTLSTTTLGKAKLNESNGAVYVYADWEPAKYTLSFNSNGSILSTKVSVTNFTKYSEYTAPAATTRNGYTFDGWFTEDNKGGNFVVFDEDREVENKITDVMLLANTTVYAGWKANEYNLDITEVSDKVNLTIVIGENEWIGGTVCTGDVLTITADPLPGYAVDQLYVNNRVCSSGIYTVLQNYANNTIVLSCEVIELTYNLTYNRNGGAWTDATYTAPATFKINNADPQVEDDQVALPDGTKLSRTGYTFGGWFMTDENGEFVGSRKYNISDLFAGNLSAISDVQLTAKWEPVAKDIMVYKNSESIALEWTDKLASAKTGEKITLRVPIPDSYKLVGLATSENGRVEYYAREADTEKGEVASDHVMYVDYTVKADDNNLYCKWIGSGELYVSYDYDNPYTYSPTGKLTLTAKSSKLYKDTVVESIEYKFTWYKWDGVRFIQVSNQTSTNSECELEIAKCEDSGTYRCELIVTIIAKDGDDYNKIVEYASNTPESLGQVIAPNDFDLEVTIGKATLGGLNLAGKTATYTSEDQKELVRVTYGPSLGELNADATLLTLPDGSTATITYSYSDKDGNTVNEIVNVGTYTVTAEFELDENSNYNDIESLSATLTVNPKKIGSVTYGIEGGEAGKLTAPYTGENVTLVATSADIFEKDAENVTILLNNATNSAVGEHTATVDRLDGSAKDNYTLNIPNNKLSCKYTIEKAQRVIDVDFVGIDENRKIEFTFDGALHTVSLADLPDNVKDQVTVTYSVRYTPNVENYSPSDNNAENNNGGRAAGTYEITVTFGEKTGNYTAKEPITATLVINKANALPVDVTVKDNNGDSFVDNQYVVMSDTVHKPVIGSLNNSDTISVSYKYEKDQKAPGMVEASWGEISTNGFSAFGQYRLTASFDYKTPFYKNNFADIDDVVINYVIVRPDLANLQVRYADEEKKITGSYGGTLDTKQFAVYAVYGSGDNATEELINNSALSYFDKSSGSEVKFDKFSKVDAAYPIVIKYSNMSAECTVNVGCATYDFDVAFENQSKTYSKDGITPDFTVNAITDVNGNAVSGVNFFFSVYNDATSTWGEYVPVSELKLNGVGVYKVKLAYKHSDVNYVGTEYTDFENEITVTVTAKSVTEVNWLYSTDGGDHWSAIPADGLPYTGKTYLFSATYDGATAGSVATVVTTATDVKEGGYALTATTSDSNYSIDATKTVVINPREVVANWFIDGQPVDAELKQLVYNGSDQFDKISASYTDVNGTKVSLTVNREQNVHAGNEWAVTYARTYQLTVSAPADKNYTVTTASKTQDITLYGLELDPSLAWFEYTTDGTNYTEVPSTGDITYAGKEISFRVTYYANEADKAEYEKTEEPGLRKKEALSVTARVCGDYELTGVNSGSFYISNKQTVHVKPAKLTVTLTNPEFDGSDKAPQFNLSGVVDGLTATDLLNLSGELKARNVKNDGNYVMHVELNDSTAAKNYVLGDDGETSIDVNWNVTPKTVTVTWGSLLIEYTGEPVAPKATITQAVNDTDVISVYVRATAIEINDDIPTVAEYILNEDGTRNYNYTIDDASKSTKYEIVKGTVTVSNVSYQEYTFKNANTYKDATFVGRDLRNDKLVGDAYVMVGGKSKTIPGAFKFVSTDAFEASNYYPNVAYTFVPTDSRHYSTVNGTLGLFVYKTAVSGIEVDASEATTSFVNGTKIFAGDLSQGLKIYQISNDYYYDEQTSTHYGTRAELANAAASATFEIDGTVVPADGTVGYTFKKAGATEVTVTYGSDADTYEVTVTNYAVDKISLNKNTKTTYYVTEKFDVSTITLNVKYMGEANVNVVNSGITVKGKYATDAFTEAGSADVTLEYSGNEFVVTVNVENRQDLNIVYTGKNLKYTGSAIALPTATLNGIELVNNTFIDIDNDGTNDLMAVYAINSFTPADKGLAPFASVPQTMLDQGAYEVKVTLNVVNIKYNDHDAIVSTFNVVDGEVEKNYQLKLIDSSTHAIITYNDNLYLTKIAFNTTVDAIKGSFEATDGKIVIAKSNGKEITGNALVGTGCTITLVDGEGNPVDGVEKLTIVVKGDMNSDGKLSALDYMQLRNVLKSSCTDVKLLAGDINGDGKLSALDYMRLRMVLSGKATIKL